MHPQTLQPSLGGATALANLLAWHSGVYAKLLQDVTDAEASVRFSPGVNSLKWIAGHMVADRFWVSGKLGVAATPPEWVHLFYTHEPEDGSANSVPLRAMIQQFAAVSEPFVGHVRQMTEDELLAEGFYEYPFGEKWVVHNLAFSVHHEAYHLGQISLLRKMVGKQAVRLE